MSSCQLPGWETKRAGQWFVHHHSELPVTVCSSDRGVVALIGYAIDPISFDDVSDQEIARRILATDSLDGALRETETLGGRWVFLIEREHESIVLHDACGLRQVFYADESIDEFFCASQPSTAAMAFKLEQSAGDFLSSRFARTDPEYWWPGDATPLRGVCCLLPNHYLDLRTRRTHRYGLSAVPSESSRRVAGDAAAILAGLVRKAATRFDLALPITAGWDSRALLAACRHAGVAPHCYTLKFGSINDAHQDVRVPARLLDRLSWKHHVLECPREAPAEFADIYRANVDPAHREACAIASGLAQGFPSGFVSVSGHCSEVARCFYGPRPDRNPTAEDLVAMTRMDATPFVLEQFGRWLDGAIPAAAAANISILDLFYWEQRAGRWAANGQAQWDLVHERFAPFNCRALLRMLLSAPERDRLPTYELYRQLIGCLAPEVLIEPVNPDSRSSRRGPLRTMARRARELLQLLFQHA